MGDHAQNDKFRLSNANLGKKSFLYHLNLSTDDNLKERFGDVKYVCMGGSQKRMANFARTLYKTLFDCHQCSELVPANISEGGNRYCLYKVGPVIVVNHGIGNASASVVLNELFKLFHYAECSQVTVFRIGTCGGLGLEPGTVAITEKVYNGKLESCFTQVVLGDEVSYPTTTDLQLAEELHHLAAKVNIKAAKVNTMGTDCFYEGQARLDGAFCGYTAKQKADFLEKAHKVFGIGNIEMESTSLTALCGRANVKCAVVCAVIVNRLKSDEVSGPVAEWEEMPQKLIMEYLKAQCLNC